MDMDRERLMFQNQGNAGSQWLETLRSLSSVSALKTTKCSEGVFSTESKI